MKVPGGAKGMGLGAIAVVIIASLLGLDPSKIMGLLDGLGGGSSQAQTAPIDPASDEYAQQKAFLETVLAYTEDVWHEQFQNNRMQYSEPTMVIFSDVVSSACGQQASAVGPFYCGGDHKLYLDMTFFRQLARQLKAKGDFAQAYVVAHEIGHHIQTLLDISPKVHRQQQGMSKADANRLSVRLELQADFYAGVWAHHAERRNLLERGDLAEAMNAAKQIGDDTLQRGAGQTVRPDSFTHGTSDQRRRWFNLGFETGDMTIANRAFELSYGQL